MYTSTDYFEDYKNTYRHLISGCEKDYRNEYEGEALNRQDYEAFYNRRIAFVGSCLSRYADETRTALPSLKSKQLKDLLNIKVDVFCRGFARDIDLSSEKNSTPNALHKWNLKRRFANKCRRIVNQEAAKCR